MADDQDKDSKSEEPTEKKIADALEKGNVPFSREVTNVLSILAISLVVIFYAPEFAYEIANTIKSVFANTSDWPLDTGEDVMNLGSHLVFMIGVFTLPMILPIAFFGLLSAVAQNKPGIVTERLKPKLERISLAKGIKRLLGMQGLREFLKSMFKFSIAGITASAILAYHLDWVISHLLVEAIRMPLTIHQLIIQAALGITLLMVILGLVDLIWVRREWFENLRMTHQEIKDERKQAEGDPMIKVRSRSIARDRARNKMIANVRDATVIVANPTHFSVALRYQPEIDNAPFVLAKGQDLIALKIREIAEENDIPIIEDKPLARSLYKACNIDQEIPVEFYVPIARIVRVLSEKG